jgi:hypothetical protein
MAARIQGFPDEWQFSGKKTSAYRQIGNAFPPPVAFSVGRSDLKPGQYLLEIAKPLPAFARQISKETRVFVLDRNGFTCQMCGAVAGEEHPYDATRKTRLHLGHIIDKSMGGSDEPANLRALCSVCNEGASNATLTRPDLQKLLIQVRRATSQDQIAVLRWLQKKFPA